MAKSSKRQLKETTSSLAGPAHDHSKVLMDDGSINISQSKVKVWRDCKRAYHNKFVLGLRKKIIKRPFMFGHLMHKMAEEDLEGRDAFELLDKIQLQDGKMFKKQIDVYGEILLDIRDIMTDYFSYWDKNGDLKPLKGKDGRYSEHEFRIEIGKGIWFTGKIDAVAKSRKLRWIIEHKTFNRQPSMDDQWRSVQGAVYFKATEIMGFDGIDGVLWDYIWSKAPSVPTKTLLDGSYSLSKINSLPSRLRRWAKNEKLNIKDYKKLVDEAKENRSQYFRRVYMPIKPRIVDSIWDGFMETANEIAQDHGTKKSMNIGRHCAWCDFQDLCKAEMVGSDIDFIKRRLYTDQPEKKVGEHGDDRSED